MSFRLLSYMLVGATALLAGCTSSGTAPNPPTSRRASHVVIGSISTYGIATFSATASGSVAPTYNIAGGSTGLYQPYNIFVDKANSAIWASNWGGGSVGTITKYSLAANGNVAPSVTIGPGGSTTLLGPTGIYVRSDGSIVVADYDAGTIDFFASGASGTSVSPTKQITGLSQPESLWVDSGGNIWVANQGTSSVLEFSSSASGAATPITTITGVTDATGLYVDGHNNIWVTGCTYSAITAFIDEFAAGSSGAATPTRTIVGSSTNQGCPYGVAVDGAGYIYEADISDGVNVFSPGANGNATPVQTIPQNATTTLSEPSGIGIY